MATVGSSLRSSELAGDGITAIVTADERCLLEHRSGERVAGLDSPRMDAFSVAVLTTVLLLVAVIVLLGLFYPGSGAEQLGWRTPRARADTEAARDSEDLAQLLEAANARRRARGEPELTVDGLAEEEPK